MPEEVQAAARQVPTYQGLGQPRKPRPAPLYPVKQLIAALRAHRRESARRRLPFERLTPRERHVLEGLVEGTRADEIAAASFVSVTTVRNQIQSVLTKLGAGSQIEAVAMARRAGWPS